MRALDRRLAELGFDRSGGWSFAALVAALGGGILWLVYSAIAL
jgi:hypothetical protein